jgi:hypothetical protein
MDDVVRIREQQHTGNHPGTDAPAGATFIVTPDDAREHGWEPTAYVAAMTDKLRPYGVVVRFEPERAGYGGLIGVVDTKQDVEIRQAIAMVNTKAT